MAVLLNTTISANATSPVTVVPNTIVGIECSQPVYVLAANGALVAETLQKDAINIIPTAASITIKAKDVASLVTVNGQA